MFGSELIQIFSVSLVGWQAFTHYSKTSSDLTLPPTGEPALHVL